MAAVTTPFLMMGEPAQTTAIVLKQESTTAVAVGRWNLLPMPVVTA